MVKVAKLWPAIADDTPLDEAEEMRRVARPSDFPLGRLTESEFMGIAIPDPRFILRGLIVEKSITIVNGSRGCGKSWLVESIANEVTWGGQVGPWKVEEPVNVMFVDGEMSMSLLQTRLKMMNKGRNVRRKPKVLHFYPESYAYRIGLKRVSILDPAWREYIIGATQEFDIGLLILDNLSSLAPGIDENEKMAFDPVNRWLLELRFHDVATLMAHHTGKSGKQRGTTAHEDHVDTAIQLNETRKAKRTGKCGFVCHPTKDRASVVQGRSYTMELVEGTEGRMEFAAAEVDRGAGTKLSIAARDLEGMTWREAKDKWGVSKASFYRIRERR